MSAIWGYFSFENQIPENVDGIMSSYYTENCMVNRIEHYKQQNLYFGCGIQYITKEGKSECLPYSNTDAGFCLTADCILDNREELLQKLELRNSSLPDGTILAFAYAKWGMKCLEHLRGLFSFAVYDSKKHALYLAADQVSGRCLYYYTKGKSITFSTLITPIRKLHKSITINQLYIKDYLTAPGLMPNILPEETPFCHLNKLNPASYIEITESGEKEFIYWTPEYFTPEYKCCTPKDYGNYFRRLYESCVKDALRTNGNVGIALSSGLDSASVGAIAADYLKEDSKDLFAYTYVPSEPISTRHDKNHIIDEEDDVKKIAGMHPNIVTHFLTNDGKSCFGEIAKGIAVMEIPYKAFENLPSLFEIYEKASKASCKVVLSGQMGNSTVSYGYIDNILYDLYSKKHYITFLKYLNRYSKTVNESRKKALKGCIRYFRYTKKQYKDATFDYSWDNPFLSKDILQDYPLRERYLKGRVPLKGNLPAPDILYQDYLQIQSAYTYLGELETKAGLKFGLLLRDPTKDMRILGFCYHLPYHLYAYQGTPRWLIRHNTRDILPASILDNWMRYGVQNVDCHIRLMRDWSSIYPKIKDQILSQEVTPYIDVDKSSEFLTKTIDKLQLEDETDLRYLIMLYIVGLFRRGL